MTKKTRILFIITCLVFINFIYGQIDETAQDTTSGIIKILEHFGIKITEPLKALILVLLPILIRFFEKKKLNDTITEQEQVLFENGIELPKKKSFIRKIWERISYRN